jgi:hypothetical protein
LIDKPKVIRSTGVFSNSNFSFSIKTKLTFFVSFSIKTKLTSLSQAAHR